MIEKINSELKIVKLNGQKFAARGGYIKPDGYALQHPNLGFLSFKGSLGPYRPVGGKKVLESILSDGGFVHFDNNDWLQPL